MSKGKESEDVLERLKASKLLTKLHLDALERVQSDPEFNQHVLDLVSKSKAVRKRGNLSGVLIQSRLKEELEAKIVDEAAQRLWQVISSRENGMELTLEAYVNEALLEVLDERIRKDKTTDK